MYNVGAVVTTLRCDAAPLDHGGMGAKSNPQGHTDADAFAGYARDFFAANPNRTEAEARACFLGKRSRCGTEAAVTYDDADLRFLRRRDPT